MEILIGFGLKLFTAVVAFIALRWSLGSLDKILNFSFREWFNKASSAQKAEYLSYRYLGTCILFGLILL